MNDAQQKELPKSPNEMPHLGATEEGRILRNWFVSDTELCDSIEITFESHPEYADDDQRGIWQIEVFKNNKRFYVEHAEFVKAMWFIIQHLSAKNREDYERWQSERRAALSKLTERERQLLRLSG